MIEVTVIIPIYNTEQYIDRCLDSVLLPSSNDLEIICINDGSTDSSLVLCEKRRKKDKRIKIISQKNQGTAIARNNGLKNASGKWIFFVDSDDVVLPGYYDVICKCDEKYDVILFDGIWGEKKYQAREKEITYPNYQCKELISHLLMSKSISNISHTSLRSPCMKAYKRSFLENNNILFPQKIKIGEDMLFNISVFALAKEVLYKPIDVYKEIDRIGSATHSFIPDMIENDLLFQKELKHKLQMYGLYDKYKNIYYSEVKSGILRCLRKQVFWNETFSCYSKKQQLALLDEMLCSEIYTEACRVKDNNKKRNFILFLYKRKLVTILRMIFYLEHRHG